MTTAHSLAGVSLVVYVGVVACGGEVAERETIVRDSAGIAIVENGPAPGEIALWRLAEPPLLELGRVEGDPAQQFNEVVGAARLGDGTIVVGDGGSKEIRLFDARGEHVRTAGGPGGGPGEFGRLWWIDRIRGDTVAGSDWPVGTLNWFDPSGVFVDKERRGVYRPGLVRGVFWDGTLPVELYPRLSYGNEVEWWIANGTEETFRPAGLLLRVGRDGEKIDTLRRIEGEEFFRIGAFRQDLVVRPLPFTTTTQITWSGDRIFIGETARRQVEVRRLDGSLERLIRWESESVPVTGRDRGAHRDETLASMRREGRRPDFERWLAAVPYPEVKPAFQTLVADRAGRLWVEPWNDAASERATWTVFDAEGRRIAGVDAPTGLEMLELGEGYALALWKDALDVEFVRLYSVER